MRRERMGRPGLMGTMARTAVIAGTATVVSGTIRDKQMEGMQAKEQAQAAAATVATPAPVAAPASVGISEETINQLKQLADLKNQGILTQDEFDVQKAKLLGE